MPLTPADIHNVAFKKPPMGKRGYGEEEVDAFLDEAEQELIRLLEANASLKEQVRRGPDPSATMVLDDEVAGLAAQLDRLVAARDRAEQRARDLQAQLEQAHRDRAPAPAAQGDGDVRVLMMAQRTADEYMRDAERESETVLADARVQAERLLDEAQSRAGTMEADAQRGHAQAMADLAGGRADLLDEIDRLGRFARGYHAALQQHVADRLRDADGLPEL